jgi:hypothetical protein
MRRLYTMGAVSLLAMVAMSAANEGSGKGRSIKAALGELDVKADNDWTEGGLPAMERMKALTGNQDLKRSEVSDAAPGFNRTNAGAAPTDKTTLQSVETPEPGASDAEHAAAADANIEAGAVGKGNPLDAENNADSRVITASHQAEHHPDPIADDSLPTAAQIAEGIPDAILLFEALTMVAGSSRYARNSALATLVRGYQGAQGEIKAVQGRLDARMQQREERSKA